MEEVGVNQASVNFQFKTDDIEKNADNQDSVYTYPNDDFATSETIHVVIDTKLDIKTESTSDQKRIDLLQKDTDENPFDFERIQ